MPTLHARTRIPPPIQVGIAVFKQLLMPVLTGYPSSSTAAASPTTRSRTLLFISYRDSTALTSRPARPSINAYDDNDPQADEHQRLIGTPDHDFGHVSLEMSSPPKWFV